MSTNCAMRFLSKRKIRRHKKPRHQRKLKWNIFHMKFLLFKNGNIFFSIHLHGKNFLTFSISDQTLNIYMLTLLLSPTITCIFCILIHTFNWVVKLLAVAFEIFNTIPTCFFFLCNCHSIGRCYMNKNARVARTWCSMIVHSLWS